MLTKEILAEDIRQINKIVEKYRSREGITFLLDKYNENKYKDVSILFDDNRNYFFVHSLQSHMMHLLSGDNAITRAKKQMWN